jgi:GR25 family glycosyltransferase involved in LPS biosynthesis
MIEFTKFVINLDERKDRLAQFSTEIKKLDIGEVLRFPAVKATPGMFGCLLSHLYCLTFAKNAGHSAMIFEDDVEFINNYKEILPAALAELAQRDWALFYLGGNIWKGKVVQETDHLGRLDKWCQSTHAMCINQKYIDQVIATVLSNYGLPIDMVYTQAVIPNVPCFITVPKMIATQRDSYSSIENQNVRYSDFMEQRYTSNLILKNP